MGWVVSAGREPGPPIRILPFCQSREAPCLLPSTPCRAHSSGPTGPMVQPRLQRKQLQTEVPWQQTGGPWQPHWPFQVRPQPKLPGLARRSSSPAQPTRCLGRSCRARLSVPHPHSARLGLGRGRADELQLPGPRDHRVRKDGELGNHTHCRRVLAFTRYAKLGDATSQPSTCKMG